MFIRSLPILIYHTYIELSFLVFTTLASVRLELSLETMGLAKSVPDPSFARIPPLIYTHSARHLK